jgi:hypothetical protein
MIDRFASLRFVSLLMMVLVLSAIRIRTFALLCFGVE